MNQLLWTNILDFDLDAPLSAYGFSARLENENFWPVSFAREAIVEYKKFMYLAAISDQMVSPSAIVDVVWHQHLVFTQSYDDFCAVLGKKIIHMPSTHLVSEFEKFKLAGERTSRLYTENFGPQPAAFWLFDDVYGPLMMEKSRYTIYDVFSAGLLFLIPAIVLGYFALRPWYVTIDNPDFLFGYAAIVIISVIRLEYYNCARLMKIVKSWDEQAFVFDLSALELVYLRRNQIRPVINGVVNQLILADKITVLSNQMLAVDDATGSASTATELSVLDTIKAMPNTPYYELVKMLELKPAFNKTARAMDRFKNYFGGSAPFVKLFALNFAVLFVVLVMGAIRLATGIVRDKPVTLILGTMIACLLLIIGFLYRLTISIGSTTLTQYYKETILPNKTEANDWGWEYFLLGSSVFASSFAELANYQGNNSGGGSDSSGSSCGSGGGDSGSSCGGCGSS